MYRFRVSRVRVRVRVWIVIELRGYELGAGLGCGVKVRVRVRVVEYSAGRSLTTRLGRREFSCLGSARKLRRRGPARGQIRCAKASPSTVVLAQLDEDKKKGTFSLFFSRA